MLRALKLSAENRPNNTTLVEWFLDTYFDQNVVYHSTGLSSETSGARGAVRISTIHSSKGLEFPSDHDYGAHKERYYHRS